LRFKKLSKTILAILHLLFRSSLAAPQIWLAFVFLLVGCDLSSQKDPPAGYGNVGGFQVITVTGGADSTTVDVDLQIATEKLFNFEACVIDNLFQKKVSNQKFTVFNGKQALAHSTTDDTGCLTWQERIPFNFVDQSHYVSVERIIQGEGSVKGQQNLHLAINPWMHGEKIPEVVDIRKKDVGITAKGGFTEIATAPLWLERFEIQDISEWELAEGRMTLKARIRIPTQFLAHDTQNREVPVAVPGGAYDFDFFLYQQSRESQKTNTTVLDQVSGSAISERGYLVADILLKPRQIPSFGLYKIGLRLKPKNKSRFLTAFEGTFDIGSAATTPLSGTKTAQVDAEVINAKGRFSIHFLEELVNTSAIIPTGYSVAEGIKCTFDKFKKENTTHRTLSYRVNACIARRDGQTLRADLPISVIKNRRDDSGNPEVVPLLTDSKGCIDWEDSMDHRYFESERRMLATFTVEAPELGLKEQVPLQINPWDYGWTFCHDARRLEIKEKEELLSGKPIANSKPSEYFIDQLSFVDQQVDYEVDNNLDRQVIKTIRLGLNPKVRRPSSQTYGENQVEPLRTGLYLLRYVLLRNSYEDSGQAYAFVAGGEIISQVVAGRLIKDVQIKLKDARLADSRNRLLIELSTIKEDLVRKTGPSQFLPKIGMTYDDIIANDSGLPPKIFEGALELSNPYVVPLFPFDTDRLHGLANAQIRNINTQQSSDLPYTFDNLGELLKMGNQLEIAAHENQNSLKSTYFSLQDLVEVKESSLLNSRDLIPLIDSEKVTNQLYEKLCHYWSYTMIPKSFADHSHIHLPASDSQEILPWCSRGKTLWFDKYEWTKKLSLLPPRYFVFQIVNQVKEAKLDHLEPPGRNFGILLSSTFMMVNRFTDIRGVNLGWKTSSLAAIPVIGKLFEIGPAVTLDQEYNWGKDTMNLQRFDVGTKLDVEETDLAIALTEYRRCLVVRLNPVALDDEPVINSLKRVQGLERDQTTRSILQSGVYVCQPWTTQPKTIVEKYFYVQTPKPHGYQQDPTDLRNRSYSVQLRSDRDFQMFLKMGKANFDEPSSYGINENSTSAWIHALDKSVTAVSPAYPGFFVENAFQ
jgi:hypothetical protein